MSRQFLPILQQARANHKKLLAVLVDPDKITHLDKISQLAEEKKIDAVLVGGSLMSKGNVETTTDQLKNNYRGPVIIFPGDFSQASAKADAIFFLSLISGRNADLLIGKHVMFAPQIRQSGLEVIPCGYILVNSGTPTSVEYVSNTVPIPHNKPDIAMATALAGEMLGLQCIYMESGSGAEQLVTLEMIRLVSENVQVPLIIGGGIKTYDQVKAAWNAGATMVVIGTAIENDPDWLAHL
jgi:putative glycerol-1-phosphate prenyltransferase